MLLTGPDTPKICSTAEISIGLLAESRDESLMSRGHQCLNDKVVLPAVQGKSLFP